MQVLSIHITAEAVFMSLVNGECMWKKADNNMHKLQATFPLT